MGSWRSVAGPTQVPLHGGQRATETVCDEAQRLVRVSPAKPYDVLGGNLVAAADDSGEGSQIVGTHLDAEVGADARALTRCGAGNESCDVVIEDGILEALLKEWAARARGASAGLQCALQALFVRCSSSAVTFEQGMLEDRSEVGAGREITIIRPIHDGSFPMGQGGVCDVSWQRCYKCFAERNVAWTVIKLDVQICLWG